MPSDSPATDPTNRQFGRPCMWLSALEPVAQGVRVQGADRTGHVRPLYPRSARRVWPSSSRSAGPSVRCSPAPTTQTRVSLARAHRRLRIPVRRRCVLVHHVLLPPGDLGVYGGSLREARATSPRGTRRGHHPSSRDNGLLVLVQRGVRCAVGRWQTSAYDGAQARALKPGHASPAGPENRRHLLWFHSSGSVSWRSSA